MSFRVTWDAGARFAALADYADYARKRDKENALTERGSEGGAALARRRRGTGWRHVAEASEVETDSGLIAGRTEISSSPRSVSAFRCTRDDIDETGGAA